MPSSPLAGVFSRFNSVKLDAWDYREDLQNLAAFLADGGEADGTGILMSAVGGLDTFRGEASIRDWLHVVASNECQTLGGRETPGPVDTYLDRAIEGRLDEPPPNSRELALELANRRRVLDAFAALPDNYRSALLLKDGHRLTVEQTATLTATSPGATRSILYRARHQLRAGLTP